jgi:hypothetical protein
MRSSLGLTIKKGINQSRDYHFTKNQKLDDVKTYRESSLAERRLIESAVKQADDADARLIEERRMKLRNITVEDRKAK